MATGSIVREGIVELWANPSPSASYSANTVPLDLSSYDYVIIDFKTSGEDGVESKLVHVGESCMAQLWRRTTVAESLLLGYRIATVSSTGVSFAAGKIKAVTSTNAAATSNTDMIPLRICGLRAALFI